MKPGMRYKARYYAAILQFSETYIIGTIAGILILLKIFLYTDIYVRHTFWCSVIASFIHEQQVRAASGSFLCLTIDVLWYRHVPDIFKWTDCFYTSAI